MPKIFSMSIRSPQCPHPHAHLVVNNLEQFLRLRNPPCLHLAPYWHVIHRDLESSRGDELSFHSVAQEESHHASVQLVLHHPGPPPRRGLTKLLERIEGYKHSKDDHHLHHADCLGDLKPVPQRSEIVASDGEVWVFLLQYTGILLKYLLVPSRVAVQELYARSHQVLGELWLRNVFVSLCCHGGHHQEQGHPCSCHAGAGVSFQITK